MRALMPLFAALVLFYMRVVFIVNSISRHYSDVIGMIDQSKGDFPTFTIEIEPTKSAGDAFRIAHHQVKSGMVDAIVACGGDGTVNEVLNGVAFAEPTREVWMGVYQCGSANDLTKSMAPKSIPQILSALEKKQTVSCDVGLMEHDALRKRFINASTGGIGGLVMRRVESGRSSLPPRMNYTMAILKSILVFQRPKVRITIDEEVHELFLTLIAIGNGTYMGFGLGFTPQSTMSDGLFGVTILKHASYYQLALKYLLLRKAKQVNHPWLVYLKGKRIRIEVLEGRLPIETDGEYYDVLDAGESIEYSFDHSRIKWV